MAALRGTNSRQPARPLAIRRKPPSYGLPMGGHYHRPQKSWKTRSNGGANSSTKCRYRKGRLAVCACPPQLSGDIGQIEIPQRSSAVLSYPLFGAREALGSETPRVRHAARRRGGGVAARGARTAGRTHAADRRALVYGRGRSATAGAARPVRAAGGGDGRGRQARAHAPP